MAGVGGGAVVLVVAVCVLGGGGLAAEGVGHTYVSSLHHPLMDSPHAQQRHAAWRQAAQQQAAADGLGGVPAMPLYVQDQASAPERQFRRQSLYGCRAPLHLVAAWAALHQQRAACQAQHAVAQKLKPLKALQTKGGKGSMGMGSGWSGPDSRAAAAPAACWAARGVLEV